MAKIVLGLGTSHSPQLSVRAKQWSLMREKDERDPRMDYQGLLKRAKAGIDQELTESKMQERDDSCLKAIGELGRMLKEARPDVVVIFGDDQHEQFYDDNMPTFAIYHGKSIPVVRHSGRNTSTWKAAEENGWAETAEQYPTGSELAEHLIKALTDNEFDVTRCNRLREEIGVGHAFSFLYRRLLPGCNLPMVPVMVNTYYPPNQPTPKRCYALGQTVRQAIESWDGDSRVAVIASGGLSHTVIAARGYLRDPKLGCPGGGDGTESDEIDRLCPDLPLSGWNWLRYGLCLLDLAEQSWLQSVQETSPHPSATLPI